MRATVLAIAALTFVLSASVCAQTPVDKTREKAEKASPGDCAKVCFEAARQLVEASNQMYSGGDAEGGLKLMHDAVRYAKRGTEASIQSRKHEKNAEIMLRKMAKRMHEVGQSLALDDRDPVFKAEEEIENLRDEMLATLFGNPKKTLEQEKKK